MSQPPRIVSSPNICGGDAFVLGTRAPVWLLILGRRTGNSDARLLDDHPSLEPEDLDAAWEYYRRHPPEIERAIWLNDTAANHPAGAPVPAWLLIQGALLGIPEADVAGAFKPAVRKDALEAAWAAYRAAPAGIDQQIARSRMR